MSPRRIAIVAGEHSGDLLAADLIAALKARLDEGPELVGVGGPALEAQGLEPLFDYSELSIIGVSAVLAQLPKLLARIRQTADAIVAARPDCLIIVDSPDFTHRVARRVKKTLPELPVVDYVCPTVWAWRPGRARAMRAYIDHVLAIFPFEPEVVEALGGPPLTYVGHRLMSDPGLAQARALQVGRRQAGAPEQPVCLLLPGSRRGEIARLSADLGATARLLAERNPGMRFLLPAAGGREETVRAAAEDWQVPLEIVSGNEAKWHAFGNADAAVGASGTVHLELALAGVPAVSIYRLDPMARMLSGLLVTWSACLPNLIADRAMVQEYYHDQIRPARIGRLVEEYVADTPMRAAMLGNLEEVHRRMATDRPPPDIAAEVVARFLE